MFFYYYYHPSGQFTQLEFFSFSVEIRAQLLELGDIRSVIQKRSGTLKYYTIKATGI